MTALSKLKRSADKAKAGKPEQAEAEHAEQSEQAVQTEAEETGAEETQAEKADVDTESEAEAKETESEKADAEAAEDDGDSTDEKAADEKGPRRTSRFRAGTQILAVLALVAVVLAAAVVFLWIKDDRLKATDEASRQAVHAASQAARDLSSYDYRTLESDFKTATGQTTGRLHTEYAALAQQIRTTAIQQQAISQTTVIKAGAENVTADKVTVIVFANRSATTTSSQNRLPEPLRIRMTMLKVKERWLASDLQVL